MKKIGILVAAVIVLGATGFFAYTYFLSPAKAKAAAPAEAGEEGEAAAAEKESGGEEEGGEKAGESEGAEAGAEGEAKPNSNRKTVLYPLKTFVVNLGDPQKDRYLKTTLALLVKRAVEKKLSADDLLIATVMDRILTILSTKTSQELMSSDGKFMLKQEITLQLNSIIGEDSVQDLFFVDFIIQ